MAGWQPQYPPQQPPQQPRKSRRGLAFLGCGGLGAIVALIAALGASHSSSSSSAAPAVLPSAVPVQTVAAANSAAPAKPAAHTLTYVVTGSAADVTYGPTGTNVGGTVPLNISGPLGDPLYYSIQAQLQGGGTVSCELEIDGKVISSSTASGGYNIAMCEISRDPLSGQWTDTNQG